MAIVLWIVRFFQLLFAVIVLALSITAVRWQVYGAAPAASGYAAFAGAWGTLTALIGIVAIFITSLSGIIMAAIDGLAFIILLAGGIAYAVKIGGTNCGDAYNDYSKNSPILNDLMYGGFDGEYFGLPVNGYQDVLKRRCDTTKADAAFLFLACFASLAAAIVVMLAHRRGSSRHAAV